MTNPVICRIIFGLIMSITMAYGMEGNNAALEEGALAKINNQVFRVRC